MRSFYIRAVPGFTALTDPLIAATSILSVKREGVGFKPVASAPGPRDFVYDGRGILTFANAFNPGERIYILCL